MKGLLIHPIDINNPEVIGLTNKMFSQKQAFKDSGVEVDLVYFKEDEIILNNKSISSEFNIKNRWNRYLNRYIRSYNLIINFVEFESIDFVYIRYALTTPFFLLFLKKLKEINDDVIILIEIPSYPYRLEKKSLKQRLFLLMDKLTNPLLKKYVDQIVTYSKYNRIFGIPSLCTDNNGINLKTIKLKKPKEFSNKSINLIAVAGLSKWHGYDRVINGMYDYYKKAEIKTRIYFFIVGDGPELGFLKTLTKKFRLERFITFTGAKDGTELDDLFDKCDLAIGSLGLHRLRISNGSTIKGREYCARGIPFIIGYNDIGINNQFEFVYKVSADEEPINIDEVIKFHTCIWSKFTNPELIMRQYASNNLTWKSKIKPIIAKIQELRIK